MKIAAYAQLHRGTTMPTGVGQHLIHMVRGLLHHPGIDLCVLAPYNQLDRNGRIPAGDPLAEVPVVGLPLGRRWLEGMWEQLNLPKVDTWCPDADWIYTPTEVYVAGARPRLAVTVHDLHAFEPDLPWSETPEHRAFRRRWTRMMTPIIARASCILTVSEFTRDRLSALLHVAPERVAIIGNGVGEAYFEATSGTGDSEFSDRPYVMVVGGLSRRKGADRVLCMARELRRELPEMRVLVAGRCEAEFCAPAAAIGNMQLLQYVPTDRLARLLRGAIAALMLSRYEGFGIPVLEAMASGAPVISGRAGALPEVVGNAGVLVDADDPAEIVSVIKWLSSDPASSNAYRTRGAAHAQHYRWDRCVERMVNALQSR